MGAATGTLKTACTLHVTTLRTGAYNGRRSKIRALCTPNTDGRFLQNWAFRVMAASAGSSTVAYRRKAGRVWAFHARCREDGNLQEIPIWTSPMETRW